MSYRVRCDSFSRGPQRGDALTDQAADIFRTHGRSPYYGWWGHINRP